MSKQVVPLNLFRLTKLTENENETINFCRSFGLFPSEIRCLNYNILLEKLYHFKNRNATTFCYQCNRRLCRSKGIKNSVTLRANTWFSEARISIQKSLFMTYCYVYQMSYSDTIRETTITSDEHGKLIQTSRETVCDYKCYCRDVCFNIVSELSSDQIGGNGLTVEIDESKFGKTKYHKGRYIKGQWIFGGICRETKQFFVTPVDKKRFSNFDTNNTIQD